MSATTTFDLSELTSGGYALGAAPEHFGVMRESQDLLDDIPALRARIRQDGYLLLRGLLDAAEVLDARRELTRRMAALDYLDPAHDPMEAVARDGARLGFYGDLARDNAPVDRVLKSGRMMRFFDRFLSGPSMCFDYTWLRTVAPGPATPPHCDVVYMGRGTHELYTAWTPMGAATFGTGGLIVLEGSNNNRRLLDTYCKMDVDTFCTNRGADTKSAKGVWAKTGGHLTPNVTRLRQSIGGRWVTSEFEPGDVVVFHVYTVHAGSDNRSRHVRISTDTRYQLASEPTDERWIGDNPIAHGQAGKRGRVC